ncbi:MAG TPA: hypothetical protein VEC36_05135 [Patescibacteria group bacterium]|nr:hypothetical protein [Patescibacteria group bacterium]
MKKYTKALFLSLFMAAASPMMAQVTVDPPRPDSLLTKEEADFRLSIWRGRVDSLNRVSTELSGRVTSAQGRLTQEAASLKDCNDQLLGLLGATEADLANFRQRLGVIEGRIREMKPLSDDVLAGRRADVQQLENDLNALRRERVSLIPEFYNRIIAAANEIRGLYRTQPNNTYTVGTWAENKDCLWNISGRQEIYSDPFQWPKIWQANANIIRNPDIIFPGQELTIPAAGPKTDEETRAERRYFRTKRAAAATTQERGE